MIIKPPPCKWRQIKNFKLGKIKQMFVIPTFQRDLASRHAKHCLDSILANDFYDTNIQVGELIENKKYEVYNGQHRLAALWRGYTEYGLTNYDIVLQIFPVEFGRRVFYKNNLGKALTMCNRTKTFDDGSFKFFNNLRDLLRHTVQPEFTSYANMINAIKFAKQSNATPVNAHQLEQFIMAITKTDISLCRRFLNALSDVNPHVPRSDLHRASMFRGMFKIGFENDFSTETWHKFILGAITDKRIKEFWRSGGTSKQSVIDAYSYMVNVIAKRCSIEVREVLPTHAQKTEDK